MKRETRNHNTEDNTNHDKGIQCPQLKDAKKKKIDWRLKIWNYFHTTLQACLWQPRSSNTYYTLVAISSVICRNVPNEVEQRYTKLNPPCIIQGTEGSSLSLHAMQLPTVCYCWCRKASCQICWISFTMDSSNFLHFQRDNGKQADCQISLGSKIFRRTGWEKHQILPDLICLVQSRQADRL